MEILKNESPFFISEICEKYNVTPAAVSHFISRNNRYLHFKERKANRDTDGRRVKQFIYTETVICPHCGGKIKIDDL